MLMDNNAFENEGSQTNIFLFFQNIFVKEKEIVNLNTHLEYQ